MKHRNQKAILVVIIAALTLEATALVQFFYAQRGLREEASRQAESQLEATNNKILSVVNQVETAVRNSVWIAQWCLDFPDSLPRVCQRLVADNPVVAGSTVAVVPGYLRRYPLYSPYVYRNGQDSLVFRSLATAEYDYPSQEWFTKPLELGEGYWSEPYVDEGGGEMLMTTYSIPIVDRKGRRAAVLTADLSLEWLSELVGNISIYPDAFSVLLSRSGKIMVSPVETLSMRKTITEYVEEMDDTTGFETLSKALLSGKSGNMSLRFGGGVNYVYFTQIEKTGWSMSILIPGEDIYGRLRGIGKVIAILQLIGLVILIFLMQSFIRGQIKYTELDQKRQRIEGELHIATGIQMSMVPKTFPAFPDRHDLDMAATIVPAKEVGGDLYDFFIRDEKLFFCVGDVSGKGIPASLVMAVTRTTFRNLSAKENSPGRIVTAMNDNLSAMNENNMFVTFFCGVLDLSLGILRYCNAGHNPPRILTDAIRTLPVTPNLPLGILRGFDYDEQEVPFNYDDAIFLYTDGLTEAENAVHEQYGEERMEEVLRTRNSSEGHLDDIKQSVAAFVGDAPQSDDLTILFIHYLPDQFHLSLYNKIEEIEKLPGFVTNAVKASKLDPELIPSLNLAIEEIATNVIMYAYPERQEETFSIDAAVTDTGLTFTITDSGKAFDPTAKEDVDINAGVSERPIGGLGIHLVRTIMDEVHYKRTDGKNILILTKKY